MIQQYARAFYMGKLGKNAIRNCRSASAYTESLCKEALSMDLHFTADNSGSHWASEANHDGRVIAQLQEGRLQARLYLTPDQAEEFANELMRQAKIARYARPLPKRTA